jgi:hypothetical protein
MSLSGCEHNSVILGKRSCRQENEEEREYQPKHGKAAIEKALFCIPEARSSNFTASRP